MNTIESVAQSLGVSVASLQALGATRNDSAWTFPERDAEGRIIGTARRLDDGRKLMVPGSKRGLTMAWPIDSFAGSSVEEPILIVEGASDTAAGMDLGFVTIGRPSATGGLKYLRPLLCNRHVAIVGENDDAGRRGAEKIASGLVESAASVRILYPSACAKDLREWYTAPAGCDREELLSLILKCEPIEPQRPVQTVDRYHEFPVDVLPDPLHSFVRKASKSIGCDSSYVALPLLAATASVIGNARRLRLKRGWTEPAVVWTAIVGESGTLKSPAFRSALGPLRELQRDALREYEDKRAEYERAILDYERALSVWKKKGDGEPPEKPSDPQPARVIVSDVTVEALAPILAANWRGVLLARDELGGWLASFDRYASGKGADAAHWLSMFNAETLVVDRKTGPLKMQLIERAAVSVTGGIQPGTLRRALGMEHRENGLLARLLLASPPPKPKRWTEADIPPEEEARLGLLFDKLRELRPNTLGDTIEPVTVPLSPEGKAVWVDFFNTHAEEHADLTGDLSAASSKLEGYAARLALVVHYVRWAADDPTLRTPDAVDEKSMAAGVTLSRWFGHEARRVYAILDESDEDHDCRQLVELIQRKGGSVTPRDLMRSSQRYKTAADAELVLDNLVSAGRGRWEERSAGRTGGRPSKRFMLSDTVDVDSTPRESRATAGFVNVNTVSAPNPRCQVARLIYDARRDAKRDLAVALRDAWRERIAICTTDGGLTVREAERVALNQILAMVVCKTSIGYDDRYGTDT